MNLLPLIDEIEQALPEVGSYEIVLVDDGSSDGSVSVVAPLVAAGRVRLLRHLKRAGKSAALRTGVKAARGEWAVTVDGDGQNDPKDILRMWDAAQRDPAVRLVAGLRERRRDTWSKRAASRFANKFRQSMLRDGCTDTACGLKLFQRDAFLDMPFFGALHRFMPALFRAHGHAVAFVTVKDRPRAGGVSKYTNLQRALVGIVDLLGVFWLIRRTDLSAAVEDRTSSGRA